PPYHRGLHTFAHTLVLPVFVAIWSAAADCTDSHTLLSPLCATCGRPVWMETLERIRSANRCLLCSDERPGSLIRKSEVLGNLIHLCEFSHWQNAYHMLYCLQRNS